ncbi:MAG: dTDP-glucose 4,6-dehydratase [Nanopusillaceae archaeon]
MKLLVTGGLGFIGSNFIRYYLTNYEDVKIINVDALKYGSNPENLKDFENDERYKFIKGDTADYNLISEIIKNEKPDIIVNFAAETHVDRSISNPESFIHSNYLGVFSILESIRKINNEIKLVHISTDEVYGSIEKGSFKENDRLEPSSPYSASKAAADLLIISYIKTYKIKANILRCVNNYGPYQFPEKLIPKTIIRALNNLPIPIYGTGKNIRQWIYVEDFVRAIELVINKGENGEIYNLSTLEEKTNLEVVKTILKLLNKDENLIKFVEDRPGHDFRYSIDPTKIIELGWKPKYKFEDGIKLTVDWYMNNEWWWKLLANEKVLAETPWKYNW